MGSRKLIGYMNDVKYSINSYTMNRPAIELGIASLADEEYFKRTVSAVVKTREWTAAELVKRGFSVTASKANFVFASPRGTGITAPRLFTKLRNRDIYVRWWDKVRLCDWLRISIGTDEDMQTFMDAVDDILRKELSSK